MNDEATNTHATEQTKKQIATTYVYQRPAVQVALYVLGRIHNKKLQAGGRLFSEQVVDETGATKQNYRDSLLFLEGAGAVVNEVVIVNTLPKELIERYGLLSND